MRTLLALGLSISALSLGCSKAELSAPLNMPEVTSVVFNAEDNPTVQIKVPGLHCEHCAASACKLIERMNGVADVEADAETKLVTISVEKGAEFDSEAARESLAGTFGEAEIIES